MEDERILKVDFLRSRKPRGPDFTHRSQPRGMWGRPMESAMTPDNVLTAIEGTERRDGEGTGKRRRAR